MLHRGGICFPRLIAGKTPQLSPYIEEGSMKITELEVHILRAPDEGRPHWVSHFVVPRANEILVRMRTDAGVGGVGLAISFSTIRAPIRSTLFPFRTLIIGQDPLA